MEKIQRFALARKVKRSLRPALLRLLPKNRAGDKLYAYLKFLAAHKRRPKRLEYYNDVIYRLKTSNELLDPLRVFVTDKLLAKLYVRALIGDRYNVPTLAILESQKDIYTYPFPTPSCIKPTHLSGAVEFRTPESSPDRDKIALWLERNHYFETREVNYRHLKPRVIVEPILFGSTNVNDYKFFCYQGETRLIQVDVDRRVAHARRYFDSEWQSLPFSTLYPLSSKKIPKPENLSEMLSIANTLSADFEFIRVDIYSDGQECFVGELTNCPDSAEGYFLPRSAEQLASRLLFELRGDVS